MVLRSDKLNLPLVTEKGISHNRVALGASRKVNADRAAFKVIVAHDIPVRIVHEEAFLAAVPDNIAFQDRIVGVVQHDAVIAITDGCVVDDLYSAGKHDRIAKVVADRHVAGDFAVIGIHVVHRKP